MKQMTLPPLSFTARVVTGAGRGKLIGTPTINLDTLDVPPEMDEGIYACRAIIDNKNENAVLHYGPRPVFKDTSSCEVHLLDRTLEKTPEMLTVEVIQFLRDVRDFPSVDALKKQIGKDIDEVRAILGNA